MNRFSGTIGLLIPGSFLRLLRSPRPLLWGFFFSIILATCLLPPPAPTNPLASPQPVSQLSRTDWKPNNSTRTPPRRGRDPSAPYAKDTPRDLRLLPNHLTYGQRPIYLRRSAARAVARLILAAERDGIELRVVSGYRDYAHQARLYESAIARLGPQQRMVARPGRSEHHLGDTVDLAGPQSRHRLEASFAQTPEGRWLLKNARRHGWHHTVSHEPWHVRYKGRWSLPNPIRAIRNLFR